MPCRGEAVETVGPVAVTIRVHGVVQGVGFRPFVHGLARRLGVTGSVRNAGASVLIHAEGPAIVLEAFAAALDRERPVAATIEAMVVEPRVPLGHRGFVIGESDVAGEPEPFVLVDRATCDECRREHDDPSDRRYGYALLSCASCGPRFTMALEPPYDRRRTTMSRFEPCAECLREYEDPSNRRFHVEAIACAHCGPTIRVDGDATDAVPRAAAALVAGKIGAIQGLGGYHLACDATNEEAVSRLRRTKGREDRPFALLVEEVAAAERLCFVSNEERALLASPAAPIVLLARRESAVSDGVAPRCPLLGVMVAYTPLHLALARATARPLVLTSANPSEEPMPTTAEAARRLLGGAADFFVEHDREIAVRLDDSVAHVVAGAPAILRLGRGAAPTAVPLGRAATIPILAVGGDWKSSFAFGVAERAVVGHHIGELERPACLLDYERAVAHYEKMLRVTPALVVHDAHPDFVSTRFAERHALRHGARTLAVQHHHAHFAACLEDAGVTGRAIGVVFDGMGVGSDGAVWGGEFFVGDAGRADRFGHLRYVPMPGGDRASREGWRMAISHLWDAGLLDTARAEEVLGAHADVATRSTLRTMIERGINAPPTSSVGRLFDAVATLTGVQAASSYEGQAAIELEWVARASTARGAYPFEVTTEDGMDLVDVRPTIAAVLEERTRRSPSDIARLFHATVVALVVRMAERARERFGLSVVALGGGVFANALLVEGISGELALRGFHVVLPRRVPSGDGGLALGQLAVACRNV